MRCGDAHIVLVCVLFLFARRFLLLILGHILLPPFLLTYGQIDELLHEILALPYALQEISYSTYRANNAQLIFSHLSVTSINLNEFLDTLIYNDTTPNCLQWLIIFHRLISVENGN